MVTTSPISADVFERLRLFTYVPNGFSHRYEEPNALLQFAFKLSYPELPPEIRTLT